MQIFTHAWACSCISSQKVLLLSRVCVRQLSDITSNTPTHTLFTDYISLSILRCLQPINIHLSGTSLSLSLWCRLTDRAKCQFILLLLI